MVRLHVLVLRSSLGAFPRTALSLAGIPRHVIEVDPNMRSTPPIRRTRYLIPINRRNKAKQNNIITAMCSIVSFWVEDGRLTRPLASSAVCTWKELIFPMEKRAGALGARKQDM